MRKLQLTLLGATAVTVDGRSPLQFRTDKIRALLVYLVLEAGRPHQRVSLAACESHPHRHLHLCHDCLARLTTAVTLYQGELLAGFNLSDASPFEEWLFFWRERLQQQAVNALGQLAEAQAERGDIETALTYANRLAAMGEFERSLDYYYRALAIAQAQADKGRIADFQAGLAAVYAAKGDDETALTYYDLALPVLQGQGVPFHLAGPLLGKAEALYRRGEWAAARALNEEALALVTDTDLTEYTRQGQVLAAKLDLAEAAGQVDAYN